jgi:hypothetical protein
MRRRYVDLLDLVVDARVTATIYAGLTDAARAGLGAKLAEAFGA